jgi:hypothetical protein
MNTCVTAAPLTDPVAIPETTAAALVECLALSAKERG